MNAIVYTIEESTTNDINSLRLVARHPLCTQQIAERTHNRRTGHVECVSGRTGKELRTPGEVLGEKILFEKRMRELEERNIAGNLAFREIFQAIAEGSFRV